MQTFIFKLSAIVAIERVLYSLCAIQVLYFILFLSFRRNRFNSLFSHSHLNEKDRRINDKSGSWYASDENSIEGALEKLSHRHLS